MTFEAPTLINILLLLLLLLLIIIITIKITNITTTVAFGLETPGGPTSSPPQRGAPGGQPLGKSSNARKYHDRGLYSACSTRRITTSKDARTPSYPRRRVVTLLPFNLSKGIVAWLLRPNESLSFSEKQDRNKINPPRTCQKPLCALYKIQGSLGCGTYPPPHLRGNWSAGFLDYILL